MNTFEWSLPEYEDKERSRDWYWALVVIVVCASITAIIYSDYFFAGLMILGGLLLGFFSTKKPEIISYELGAKGLRIGNRLYPYKTMKSFRVQVDIKPMLLVHSERVVMPIISVPIEKEMAETIEEIMLAHNLPEENIQPHASETIMDSLGF